MRLPHRLPTLPSRHRLLAAVAKAIEYYPEYAPARMNLAVLLARLYWSAEFAVCLLPGCSSLPGRPLFFRQQQNRSIAGSFLHPCNNLVCGSNNRRIRIAARWPQLFSEHLSFRAKRTPRNARIVQELDGGRR